MCLVKRENHSRCLQSKATKGLDTQALPSYISHDVRKICAESEFEYSSMLCLPPVLRRFPMFSIKSCNDMYEMFRFKPMHVFPLGISPFLEECLINYFGDADRISQAVTKKRLFNDVQANQKFVSAMSQ